GRVGLGATGGCSGGLSVVGASGATGAAVGDAGIVGEGGVIAVPPQRKRVPRVTGDYRPKAAFVAKNEWAYLKRSLLLHTLNFFPLTVPLAQYRVTTNSIGERKKI